MRYLLAETQEQEIVARQEYLYDIFQLFFLPRKKIDGFIPLVPMGTTESSVLFVVGHYDQVMRFLTDNIDKVTEETIVLITCFANKFKPFKKYNKKLFVSEADNELLHCYCGQNYGFDFDITESELDFYNSSKLDIMQRIRETFRCL